MAHATFRARFSDPVLLQTLSMFDPLDAPGGRHVSSVRLSFSNPSLQALLCRCGWTPSAFQTDGFDDVSSVDASLFLDAGGPAPSMCDAESEFRVEVQFEPYPEASSGLNKAFCTIMVLPLQMASQLQPAQSPAKPPQSLFHLWRRRIEEIGDSFNISRIAEKTCSLLLDVMHAHSVVFYSLESSPNAPQPEGFGLHVPRCWCRLLCMGKTEGQNLAPEMIDVCEDWLSTLSDDTIFDVDRFLGNIHAEQEMPTDGDLGTEASPGEEKGTDGSEELFPSWLFDQPECVVLACRMHGDMLGLIVLWGCAHAMRSPAVCDLLDQIALQCAQAVEHGRWFQLTRQSDSHSRELIESADAIIMSMDLQGNVTLWNQKACQVLGYTSEEMLGRSVLEILDPDSDASVAVPQHFEDILTSRRSLAQFELTVLGKAGQKHCVIWNISPSKSGDGRVLGLYAIGQDITRRKELEDELGVSEKRYRNLVETTHDLYWIVSLPNHGDLGSQEERSLALDEIFEDAQILFLNRDFLGYPRETFIGKDVSFLACTFTVEGWRQFQNTCRRVLSSSRPVRHFETEHVRPEHGEASAWLLSDIFPYYENETLVGIQVLSIDVSYRKDIEGRMLQAQMLESVGYMARGVSHDFNNIINSVNNFLYLIENAPKDDNKVRLHCERIRELTSRATRLTRQMQTYARGGKSEKRPLDLNEIIRRLSQIIEVSVTRHIAEMVLGLADDLEWINADLSQVEQVIMNLCVNGVEAMGNRGVLTIRTWSEMLTAEERRNLSDALILPDEQEGDEEPRLYSVLEVRDTGCGMSPGVRAKVFEPFFTTKKTGHGLGLAAVFRVLKEHNAPTRVISEPKMGTRFVVYFPSTSKRREVLGEVSNQQVRGGMETVLVVDDEEAVCMLSEEVLKVLGYSVILAGDGDEALQIFQERPDAIDLVLMDINMPKVNGRLAGKAMRAARPEQKILFTSGYSESAQRRSLHEEGFYHFIAKPYSMLELQAAVRNALDEHGTPGNRSGGDFPIRLT